MSRILEHLNEQISKLSEEAEADDKQFGIGIHCTHGLNRTGYIIITYLMESGVYTDVEEAIECFHQAREPHTI